MLGEGEAKNKGEASFLFDKCLWSCGEKAKSLCPRRGGGRVGPKEKALPKYNVRGRFNGSSGSRP